jgi:hypothetical protein
MNATTTARQFCRKGAHTCTPAVTLTFENGTRRLHWCEDHKDDADRYRSDADLHRADAQAHRDEAAASFDRCDTDGFVSQWASGLSARQADLAAEIADNGGRAEFPALFDLDGNLVAAKLVYVNDRYSYGSKVAKWAVLADDDPRSAAVQWIKAFPVRRSTMVRKGYTEGTVLAPAKADLGGGGTGLAGALTVREVAVRTDGGFSRDVEIVTADAGYEKN